MVIGLENSLKYYYKLIHQNKLTLNETMENITFLILHEKENFQAEDATLVFGAIFYFKP